MRKVSLEERLLDIQANKLREQQKDKNKKTILEDIRFKEKLIMSEGMISVFEYFGKSGIYFLFKNEELVYIGESKCIFSRISQHYKEDVKKFNYFKIGKLVEDEKLRKKSEKKLIKRFRPILNYIHNLDKLK